MTTIVTAASDPRCPRAILDQWALLRAGKLRAVDFPCTKTSTSTNSSTMEESSSSPSLAFLNRASAHSAGSSGDGDGELGKRRGVPSAFCISTQRTSATMESSSRRIIVRRSLASWWTPLAGSLPPDPIDGGPAAVVGDSIAYSPSFVFAPHQMPSLQSQASFISASSSVPVSGAPVIVAGPDAAIHGDKEILPMSSTRDRPEPPHSKRQKHHRGIAPAESQSRAFAAAAPSSASSGSLLLTLLDDGGMETVFRMGSSASFEKIAVAYAGLVGTQPHRVQLWHSGVRIRHSQTLAEVY